MKLSVIIPIYNVEPFLRATLDSVVGQSYRDIEVIGVDDGSTDGSRQILEEYQRRDERVRVLSQTNAGGFVARRTGILEATGDYVVCIDGDDWLSTDACEQIAALALQTEADIIQYGLTIEGDDVEEESAQWFDRWFNGTTSHIEGSDEMLQRCYIDREIPWNLATKAIKTDVAKRAATSQPAMPIYQLDDFLACFYVFCHSNSWVRLDHRLYHYRFGVGMSTKRSISLGQFRRNLQYFKGVTAVEQFADVMETSPMVRKVATEVVPQYAMEDALHFVLHRLDSFADSRAWSGALAEAAGAERTVEALAAQVVSDQQALAGLRASEQRMVAKRAKYQRLFGIMCVVSAVLLAACLLILVVLL